VLTLFSFQPISDHTWPARSWHRPSSSSFRRETRHRLWSLSISATHLSFFLCARTPASIRHKRSKLRQAAAPFDRAFKPHRKTRSRRPDAPSPETLLVRTQLPIASTPFKAEKYRPINRIVEPPPLQPTQFHQYCQ
jgi:hypothetical protein